ncbi:hypothetical protein GM3709_1063 [Geminocystis sp. NIES-3709]|nr:hypothetical protein GM3709_1063 [Geminocystis sp. NIES-3709]
MIIEIFANGQIFDFSKIYYYDYLLKYILNFNSNLRIILEFRSIISIMFLYHQIEIYVQKFSNKLIESFEKKHNQHLIRTFRAIKQSYSI